MRLSILLPIRACCVLIASGMLIAAPNDWAAMTSRLIPGERVEVEHNGKFDRGIYSLSNANEIVVTMAHNGFLSISRGDVDRVIVRGIESPKLGYFRNASDQLFPKPYTVYERTGAPATAKRR